MKTQLFLFLGAFLNLIYSMKFSFQVESSSMKCLGEYLSDNTVGKIIYFIKQIYAYNNTKLLFYLMCVVLKILFSNFRC